MIKGLDQTIPLPRDLVRRIIRAVENKTLGYGSVDDLVLAGVRRELERAERTSYFLKEAAR